MKISARNVLKGKVVKVTTGAVNAEVVIELGGGEQIISIITKESAEKLGLGSVEPDALWRKKGLGGCLWRVHRCCLQTDLAGLPSGAGTRPPPASGVRRVRCTSRCAPALADAG
jgi:molybdopterin-binding protein